jgi:hypothetical protein
MCSDGFTDQVLYSRKEGLDNMHKYPLNNEFNHDDFILAIIGRPNPSSVAHFTSELLREFNPDEPRDERGRWTTGGSVNNSSNQLALAPAAYPSQRAGKTSEQDLQKIEGELKASPAANKLFQEAQKALFKDREYKGKDSLIINLFPDPKEFPNPKVTTQPVSDVDQPNASNVKTGTIWIEKNDPRENVFETLLVELAHITQRETFIDLIDNANKHTRDEFIHKMEEYEFHSMQRAAEVWKECHKDWNCPKNTPSWGDPDDVLKMTFAENFKRLTAEHKENYGLLWDSRTRKSGR